MEATATAPSLILPIAVVSPTDIARMLKELENLDEFLRQSAIRSGGQPQTAPRYSRLLDEVVVANKLNLLQTDNREALKETFQELSEHAPVLHISFSVDPPGPYVQKIVDWLRTNIESTILVRVGLQPNIGAGCVVRTTNKSFDFSLRKFFESKHDFFMEKLHEVLTPEEAANPMFDSQTDAVVAEAPAEIEEAVQENVATVENQVVIEQPQEQSADTVAEPVVQFTENPVEETVAQEEVPVAVQAEMTQPTPVMNIPVVDAQPPQESEVNS